MNHITKQISVQVVGLLVALAGCGQLAAQYQGYGFATGACSPMPPAMNGPAGWSPGPMASCCGDPNCTGCGGGSGAPMMGAPMMGPPMMGAPMMGPPMMGPPMMQGARPMMGAMKSGMRHAVHGTGPLRPGKVRAGLFGWIPPKFTGQGNQGYHPMANAYPHPYGSELANPYEGYPGIDPCGGYVNEGGTCCSPHWYDFMIEGVGITRTKGSNVALMSDNIADPNANIVLSTDDADFEFQGGYRVGGRFQLSAVMAVEANYLGGLDWSNSAAVTSNNNGLFSVFSDFGTMPFAGFEDTDQATQASVTIDSDLQSIDVTLRRMWVSPSQKHSGSWTFGVRYIKINDTLLHSIDVDAHVSTITGDPNPLRPDGFLDYEVDVRNDMVGLELGLEMAHCVTPGITLLGEAKGGVYGNNASQNTVIDSTTVQNLFGQPLLESASDTEMAYGANARAMFLWQFHPLAKLRAGYEVLFLDRVATGASNFNTQPPQFGTRFVFIDQQDQLLYHGFNVGVELGW